MYSSVGIVNGSRTGRSKCRFGRGRGRGKGRGRGRGTVRGRDRSRGSDRGKGRDASRLALGFTLQPIKCR
jgi:hypothetical protein